MLTGRDLSVEAITPPKSYRVWCVRVWSWVFLMRRPWPTRGWCATEEGSDNDLHLTEVIWFF